MPFLEDLEQPDTDKDTSKSCVFGWPDRPLDTLPPEYPPVDPPTCYPYCAFDDWPIPPAPPPEPPVEIPPEAIEHDPLLIFNFLSGSIVVPNFAGVGGAPSVLVEVTGLGSLAANTPEPRSRPDQYLGGAEIESDYILKVFSNTGGWTGGQDLRGFDLNPIKLLNEFPDIGIFLIQVSMRQFSFAEMGGTGTIDTFHYYDGQMVSVFDTNNLIGSVGYTVNLNRGYPTFLDNFLGGPVSGIFKWYITRAVPFTVHSLVEIDNVQIPPDP